MSQEYTPVDWVDETPTQPGTLINKERLDQMQSAHHYADGFEEVDAIPTADPGVDYHKVVYCTADSTFYRWDGTQWTADIDDDTKRLLLEHEADHSNPHAVTKAQVGLGNADNTSDADKPISTATASAIGLVQGYLDAHEANHNNPHQVTKAQVGLGNADNTADLDKPVSTATAAALAGKAEDSAVVHIAGIETITGAKTFSVAPVTTGNAYIIKNAGHKYLTFQDGAGTTISTIQLTSIGTINLIPGVASGGINAVTIQGQRAYAAANTSDVATIATLDQYTPMVRTTGAQTIGGIKTWINKQIYSYTTLELYNSAMSLQSQGFDLNNPPPYASRTLLQFYTGTDLDQLVSRDECSLATAGNSRNMIVHSRSAGGEDQTATLQLTSFRDGTACVRGPSRAYNTNNGTDIVNISLLKASTDVVHTTGAETIAGTKTLTDENGLRRITTYARGSGGTATWKLAQVDKDGNNLVMVDIRDDGTYRGVHLRAFDNNGTNYTALQTRTEMADGKTWISALTRGYNASYTSDVATIGTLDAYTPMVRTSGNQEVAGEKKFTGVLINQRSNYGALVLKNTSADCVTHDGAEHLFSINFQDKNGVSMATIRAGVGANGKCTIGGTVRNSDGTSKYFTIATGD